jgi:IS1 family transposase
MNFLEKIRKQPEERKAMALWIIIILTAAVLAFFWVKSMKNNFSELKEQLGKGINVSPIKDNINNFQQSLQENINAIESVTDEKEGLEFLNNLEK